ncbi:DUF317 domain-containing protein [Streptomyces sp. NPDC048331]|uniref:DUF317 domain-containing protein n=1 Tax=Streptomyces sp. NPDC048331 TaxID=3365534 RepID=UPI00371D3604
MPVTDRQLAAFAYDHENNLGSAITPRYLADAGDPRHVTHALRSGGWSVDSDPLHPSVRMTSPDRAFRLDLTPTPSGYTRWWRIDTNHGPGRWSASFNGDTPVEIVAALTDALIRPEPEEPLPAVVDILTGRGWEHSSSETGSQKFASPDGIVQMELYISPVVGVMGWNVEAARHHGEHGPQGRLWRALLDEATPAHLLAAVAEAICSPAPVLRARFKINRSEHLVQGREFAIGSAVVSAHKQRLAEARHHRPKPSLTAIAVPAPALPAATAPSRAAR